MRSRPAKGDVGCYDKSTVIFGCLSEHGEVGRRRHRENVATALGHRIRELRHAKGWSQERLAEHAGLDRSYIAGIEVGVRNPSLNALERLAVALSVRLSELVQDC